MSTKTIGEQIADLEATRASKATEMEKVVQKSVDEGRSMATDEAEQFDTLEGEVKSLEADLDRLRKLEAIQAKGAKPANVIAKENGSQKLEPDTTKIGVQVKNTEKLAAGIGFARVARCLALARQQHISPVELAKNLYGDEATVSAVTKAAVPAANTQTPAWAGDLINEGGIAFADFVEYLRERSLFGQVSDRLRRLPFDTPVLIQGSGGTAQWVGEGQAKPLTQWSYTRTKLAPLKVAAIAAITKELLNRSGPVADALIRDELARSVGATIDATFIDPDAVAVPNESPGSILNGVPEIPVSSGTTIADIRCDIAAFLTSMSDNNQSLAGSFWVMSERVAIALSLIANEVGAAAFPGITPSGGTFAGLPVFTSNYVDIGNDSSGSLVALIKGDEIFLGDEGGVQVSMSDQASLVMDDAPAHNSTTPTATSVVSMFQTNSVAILVERWLNFQRRRPEAVAWARVGWTACSS